MAKLEIPVYVKIGEGDLVCVGSLEDDPDMPETVVTYRQVNKQLAVALRKAADGLDHIAEDESKMLDAIRRADARRNDRET